MLATAKWIDDSATEFVDDVRHLLAEVAVVMRSGWQGAAASTHEDAWSEWADGVRNIVGALADDAALLRATVDSYAVTDDATAEALDQAELRSV